MVSLLAIKLGTWIDDRCLRIQNQRGFGTVTAQGFPFTKTMIQVIFLPKVFPEDILHIVIWPKLADAEQNRPPPSPYSSKKK